MTCKPIPMHPLDALYQCARQYPGGIEALATRMSMSYDTLRKKLRHQVETHILGYDGELSELLHCLEEARVPGWDSTLHALCWRHGGLFVRIPQVSNDDDDVLAVSIAESVKEHADAVSAIGDALLPDRDGKRRVDANELNNIEQQIEEAMQALVSLRDHARHRHAIDFPSGGRR